MPDGVDYAVGCWTGIDHITRSSGRAMNYMAWLVRNADLHAHRISWWSRRCHIIPSSTNCMPHVGNFSMTTTATRLPTCVTHRRDLKRQVVQLLNAHREQFESPERRRRAISQWKIKSRRPRIGNLRPVAVVDQREPTVHRAGGFASLRPQPHSKAFQPCTLSRSSGTSGR